MLVECDQDASWAHARGVGTDPGMEALVYYFDSHPGMRHGPRVIGATLESTEKQLS